MTPLQRLLDDHLIAYRIRHFDSLQEYEHKTKALITAMAESRRRSIGQLFRFAAARVAANFKRGAK